MKTSLKVLGLAAMAVIFSVLLFKVSLAVFRFALGIGVLGIIVLIGLVFLTGRSAKQSLTEIADSKQVEKE